MFETVEKLDKVRRRMLSLADGWIVLDNSDGPEALRVQMDEMVTGDSD